MRDENGYDVRQGKPNRTIPFEKCVATFENKGVASNQIIMDLEW